MSLAVACSRIGLGLSAALHLYLGAAFALDPLPWMAKLSLAATAPAGIAEMQAFYGGLMLAMAVLFGWSVVHRRSLLPGVAFMTVTYLGAALVRGIAVVAGSVDDRLLHGILLIEGAGALAGAACWYGLAKHGQYPG
jgi:hypothetical protein